MEASLLLAPLTDRQVRNLAQRGVLKAEKFGDVWLIDKASVLKEKRKRDKKAQNRK